MRKALLVLSFLWCVLTGFGQVEKGRYLIGGAVDISYTIQDEQRNFNMAIAPAMGVFVVKGLAIGGRYSFGVASRRTYNTSKEKYMPATTFTTGIGPKVSYYIGKKPLKGLVSANAGYSVYTRLYDGDVQNKNGFTAGGFLGMAYFFNQNLSLETGMYINASGYEGDFPTTRFGFSIGLAAFLDKKKQE